MITYEPLSASHMIEWGWGKTVRADEIIGYVVLNDGKPVSLGGLWLHDDGKLWAVFDSVGRPPGIVHKLGIKLMKTVYRVGFETVYAGLDKRIPKAQKWLERYGFIRDGETPDGLEIWRLDLGGTNSSDRRGSTQRFWRS